MGEVIETNVNEKERARVGFYRNSAFKARAGADSGKTWHRKMGGELSERASGREELWHICLLEGKDSRVRERLQRWKGRCGLFLSQEVT